jgi:phosphate starvation-inducible PhoH-like protein
MSLTIWCVAASENQGRKLPWFFFVSNVINRYMTRKSDSSLVYKSKAFHIEFLNPAQKMAWAAFEQHDVLFLLGPAGTGKSFLATAFAIGEIIAKRRQRIILTRPVVEAGENLGFLPGSMEEKLNPYMLPLYDCIGKLVGYEGPQRERVDRATEIAPIAFMRGRTFADSICIFDEAQNATAAQLKLFLSRFGENSKIIVTGDPQQSDLKGPVALVEVVDKLRPVQGIGIVEFNTGSIVRHPLVARILEKLG